MAWLHSSPHTDGKVRGGWHGCPTHHWPASSLQTPPRSSAATCSAERWERSSEHVVDGLATLGASTLTVPTGRVATAPLLLPYKPAAAAMRMHLAGDAAVHVSSLGSSTETAAISLPDRVLRSGLLLYMRLAQTKMVIRSVTARRRHSGATCAATLCAT